MTEQEQVSQRPIVPPSTTLENLQLTLHKLGVNGLTWMFVDGRHVIGLIGPSITDEVGGGVGSTLLEAIDDALTSLTQAIGAKLLADD